MPEGVCSAIGDARSVLYLPSAFGDLSAFPLELLRADDGWIGATRSVARLSSMRTLFELLSAGRMPSKLDAEALIVRAQDSKELTRAEAEADEVCRQLLELGLAAKVDRAPRVDTVCAALDRGMRALHYCGHGFAGQLGEGHPFEVLEGHEGDALVISAAEDVDDGRVVEPAREAHLVAEHGEELGVVGHLRVDPLDHHLPDLGRGEPLPGEEDLGHAAAGEASDQAVGPELFAVVVHLGGPARRWGTISVRCRCPTI